MLDKNVSCWKKCLTLEKMSHVGKNVSCWKTNSHVGRNVSCWKKCLMLKKMSHIESLAWIKLCHVENDVSY